MSDLFITGILPKSHFRFTLIDCSEICSHLDRIHDLDFRMSNFLSKTMMGAFFLARMVKEDQRISIQWKDEFKHSVLAYSNHIGIMKGVAYPGEFAKGDIRNEFILGSGILKVIRWSPDADPYQSFTTLVEDTFETNLIKYINDSEQQLTMIYMDTQSISFGKIAAKGLFLQALPEATDADRIKIQGFADANLNREIMSNKTIEEICNELPAIFQEEVRVLDKDKPHLICDCSRMKISQVLVSLGEQEVREILTEQGKIEVECEFCKSLYNFKDEDVVKLFPKE
ncbi:MAG: Hsp33 family molecular chaperone HslO [Leptospiraceae bacterium]|nr:Hsp33 family molecular chaperone HslO [Leptospiraceae bacterium]